MRPPPAESKARPMADECAQDRQLQKLIVAVKSLERRAMCQVDSFQDHELVRHIWNEFLGWDPACDTEYFLGKLKHLQQEWVLSRYPQHQGAEGEVAILDRNF